MAKRIVDLVKDLILDKKDIKTAIDMTAGTGKDSKFILENTQVENLTAFDIQKQAETKTKALIGEDKRFTFILKSHDQIDKYIKDPVDLIIYNLGYLPGADKTITTPAESTLKSLKKALKLIKKRRPHNTNNLPRSLSRKERKSKPRKLPRKPRQ